MKRFLKLLCIFLLIFSLSACKQARSDDSGAKVGLPSVMEENADAGMDFGEESAEGETSEEREAKENEVDLSTAFQEINGCAVIYLPKQNRYDFFHEEMCRQEVSPYSTFKIISALSGLQNGVNADEQSVMGYDGTDYGNTEWNENLTLEQAFQKSCIWYFKKVIEAVGNDEIQQELTELQYGNCDISEWDGSNLNPMAMLNGFWLDSSLKISPLEQVKVLEKIFEEQNNYNRDNIEIVKELMLAEETDTKKVYGKTGSSGNGEAWFVGFAEADGEWKYFAVYLNDRERKEQISGNKAKEIALEILMQDNTR